MTQALELYREQGARALWDRCLGFLDLTLEQAMATQHRLLEEQLAGLAGSEVGRQVFGGEQPRNAEELRRRVPLTTYEHYQTTLGRRRDDALPEPARVWVRTSGRSSESAFKWFPMSPRAYEEWGWFGIGLMLLSSARGRGDVQLRPHARFLNLTAPAPYTSGTLMRALGEAWPLRQHPPQGPAVEMLPFEQRMGLAFKGAVEEGVDYAVSLASVLAAAGERFGQGGPPPQSLRERLSRPRALARMEPAALRARFEKRPIAPRDAFRLKGVFTAGMDASLFRERIRSAWGGYPLEFFAMTEAIAIGVQTWDFRAMTVIPTLNFLEFISDNEHERESKDSSYQPRTVLLDELEAGRNYELVVTNLHGGPMIRYRTGDIVRITAMSNDGTGINLPQMAPYSRRSDVIDIGGFTRLTEKTVWLAIEMADVPYTEWTVRKEVEGDTPVVRLRIEPRPGQPTSPDAALDAQQRVDGALRSLDSNWADMQRMAGLQPLRVTFLPHGSFDRYAERRRSQGADLGHLKPVHMNASDHMIDTLLEAAGAERGS
nr:GH3-like protein [uncultured bacterium]